MWLSFQLFNLLIDWRLPIVGFSNSRKGLSSTLRIPSVGSRVRHYWQNGGTVPSPLSSFRRHGSWDEGVRPCNSNLSFYSPRLSWLKRNIKVLIGLERSMRRHKAFCSIAQKIIHKVNHWHLSKDFYKRVFQDEHIGRSLRLWEGLISEVYLWGESLWQRSLLSLGLRSN